MSRRGEATRRRAREEGIEDADSSVEDADVDDAADETPDDIDTNEGRVLALEYENMVVVNTYVPHNGSTLERHENARCGIIARRFSRASRRTKRRRLDG